MRKANKRKQADLLPEYDFSNGTRGKYSGRVSKGSPVYFHSEQESRAAAKNGSKRKKVSTARKGRAASTKTKSKKHSVPA